MFLFLSEYYRDGKTWSSSLFPGFSENSPLQKHHELSKQIFESQTDLWAICPGISHSFHKINKKVYGTVFKPVQLLYVFVKLLHHLCKLDERNLFHRQFQTFCFCGYTFSKQLNCPNKRKSKMEQNG